MDTKTTIVIITLVVMIGFGSALHINAFENADMYRIQNILKNSILSFQNNLFQSAMMSDSGLQLISQAQVGFELDKFVVDPDGYPSGDEYYDNKITECIFHSEEDIDVPICIVCKIKEKNDVECDNLWIGLDDLEHGLLLNAQIPGVTVTANANGNFPNEVMIFVSDNNNFIDDDTDLETEGVGGICTDCLKPDGEGMHIAVIPEFITGSAGDGIVDIPDDSAWGGTQTWVFDQKWFLRSFDYVDYDSNYDGEARAYSDPGCTALVATAAISRTPNGGDGSVQTITLNAYNVRCLQVEYEDSGGITNIHLECIRALELGRGITVLPNGYTGSTFLSIPLLEGGVDVQEAQSVKILLVQFIAKEEEHENSQTTSPVVISDGGEDTDSTIGTNDSVSAYTPSSNDTLDSEDSWDSIDTDSIEDSASSIASDSSADTQDSNVFQGCLVELDSTMTSASTTLTATATDTATAGDSSPRSTATATATATDTINST